MLIGDGAATVGTASFDNRAFRLNFEITAVVADRALVAEVEEMFRDDFQRYRLVEEDEYDRKPWWCEIGHQKR